MSTSDATQVLREVLAINDNPLRFTWYAHSPPINSQQRVAIMTAKFGFQVTVQERAIWIFPEDIDAASAVAKAEAVVTDYLKKELERLPQT